MIVSTTVCFKPNMVELASQLRVLREQVGHAIVVNNGPLNTELQTLCERLDVQLVSLGDNRGLAFAQNVGLELAIKRGAEFVLLMDQDSVPAAGMVARLEEVLYANPRAAAAAPSVFDLRNNHIAYFQVEGRYWPQRWHPGRAGNGKTVEAAQFIASGTFIRVSALQSIGLMRADWFIDQIDTEWCLRARSRGWTLIGVADAQLGHRLGDHVVTVWLLRTRHVPFHSPLRNYYMFRNAVLMMRQPYVSRQWRFYLFSRIVSFFLFFLVFGPQRLLRLVRMLQGLWDGVRGRTGLMP